MEFQRAQGSGQSVLLSRVVVLSLHRRLLELVFVWNLVSIGGTLGAVLVDRYVDDWNVNSEKNREE